MQTQHNRLNYVTQDEETAINPCKMPTAPTPCHESSPSSCSPSSVSVSVSVSSSVSSSISSSSSYQSVRSGSSAVPEVIAIDPVTVPSSSRCESESLVKMAVTSTRQLRPRGRGPDNEQDSIHKINQLPRAQSTRRKSGTSQPAGNHRNRTKENQHPRRGEVEDDGDDLQFGVGGTQTQLANDDNGHGRETGYPSTSKTRTYFRWAWTAFWIFVVWQILVKAFSCRSIPCYTDISLHLDDSQCEFIVLHRDGNILTVKARDRPEYVAESQLPERGEGPTRKAAQTNHTTRSKTSLTPDRNTILETNPSETKVRPPIDETMSTPLVQSSSSIPSCESISLGPHLVQVTESMRHASFPLPSLSWLANQLNTHSVQLHSHTPFTPQGPAILKFPNSTAASLTNVSATVSPKYRVFRQLKYNQEAANDSPTEEDAKHYRAAAAENFALIMLRAGNEQWEKLVFDSSALETLLQNIAGDFISFGITARSFEARLDLDLQELSSLIRTQLEEEEDEERNWREGDMAYQSAPGNTDIASERFELIVQALENVIHSARAFIRTWRRGVGELSRKQAMARAQLEPFITAMSSEEKAVGFEGLDLGVFYTPWMKQQISRPKIFHPPCGAGTPFQAGGFWLPETEDRFLLIKEMTDVVKDMEERWDVVMDHLERMKNSVRVRARRMKNGWRDTWTWTWTSWIR